MKTSETFISIDIEASGPSPSTGSMVAIGACLVLDPEVGFYREIRPLPDTPWDPETETIHRLAPAYLEEHGSDPSVVMADLAAWLDVVSAEAQPIFVGFNAAFDWMFVADYCHRFLSHNPFGISALDLKGVYMGRHGITRWGATRHSEIARTYRTRRQMTHHALDDARAQAELAQLLLVLPEAAAPT